MPRRPASTPSSCRRSAPSAATPCSAASTRARRWPPFATSRCSPIPPQPFDNPSFSRHFRLFGLVTAGRDSGNLAFEGDALHEHLSIYLRLLRAMQPLGYGFGAITVELADSGVVDLLGIPPEELAARVRAHNHAAEKLLEGRTLPLPHHADDLRGLDALRGPALARLERARELVIEPLRAAFPEARFRYDLWRLEGATYYRGLCFRINVVDGEGSICRSPTAASPTGPNASSATRRSACSPPASPAR